MKRITLMGLLIVAFLAGCAANQFDAQIAIAEASIKIEKERAYMEGVKAANKPKLLVKLDGEFFCTDAQKAANTCGIQVFNPNAKTVTPQREQNAFVASLREGKELLLGIAPLARDVAVVNAVGDMVDKASKNSGDHTTISDSGNTTTTTNSHSEANQANQTTTTTNTTTTTDNNSDNSNNSNNSINDSNNSDSSDNSNSSDNSDNSNNSNNSKNGVEDEGEEI